MATLRALTPADGALSEQVDRETGAQTSARHLTWSYAAFVSTARLRAQAAGAKPPAPSGADSRSRAGPDRDRKSVVEGKSGSVRVALGGLRRLTNKKK